MSNLQIEFLEWDTNFFGYKIGNFKIDNQVSLDKIVKLIKNASEEKFKLLYLKSTEELQVLSDLNSQCNIILADEKITYLQFLNKTISVNLDPLVKQYTDSGISNRLLEITLQSGAYSRFAIDPNFRNKEYEKLYTEWIKKSVSGEIAREVWIATNEQTEINGLLTLGLKNNIADIGLLAVDVNSRGSSIGTKLIDTAKQRAINWGQSKLQVITQLNNTIACNFYEKCGFKKYGIEYIYHIWL